MALVLCVALTLTGCKGQDNKKDDGQDAATGDGVLLYYVNGEWSGFNPQSTAQDQLATVENLIDTVMTALLEGGEDENAQTPVPYGMTYQRYTFDGQSTVSLIFTVDWEGVETYKLTLCKAAFVRTLCQIASVNKVTYELVDIVDDSHVVNEEYTEDSYANLDDILDSELETTIYLPDIMGQKLVKKTVTLDLSAADSLEAQVLMALRQDYEDTTVPLNGRTAVKGISVEDGVCTVTFNEYFALGEVGVEDEIAVYSIVDSLVALDGIQRVRLIIENSDNALGDISLEESLAGNYINLAD